MLHYLIKQRIDNIIKHKYAKIYARIVVEQVNKEEGKSEGMKNKTKIVIIKVSGLSHKKSKKSKANISQALLDDDSKYLSHLSRYQE